MTRALAFAAVILLLSVAAGCAGGAQDAGPVPGGQGPKSSTSTGKSGPATTGSTATGSTSASGPALCSDRAAAVKAVSQQGATGTIFTIWQVTNTGSEPCRSFGYPGMDFHTASGWLNAQVQRGGVQAMNAAPAGVVLTPGESLYFLSSWSDVDTATGSCKDFDRVKVTLPDNFRPARLAESGCLNPENVHVGPVSATRPA
jgi:uncharacterized protein DUF4232